MSRSYETGKEMHRMDFFIPGKSHVILVLSDYSVSEIKFYEYYNLVIERIDIFLSRVSTGKSLSGMPGYHA